MMAGLPKPGRWLLLALLFVVWLPCLATAQTVDPLPTIEEQTPSDTLQPLIDVIQGNAVATETEKADLLGAFSSAITAGAVTLDQAVAMLALASWGTLADAEAVAAATSTIVAVLQGLADGTLVGDPLIALAEALAPVLTPDGVRNAISRAGGSEELLAQVDELVSVGVPPGILVRLTKQSFRDGLDQEAVGLLLDELAATADGDAWGQVVNAVLGTGAERHQDREANANQNKGKDAGQEAEEEENEHGNGNNGKKG